MKITKLVLVIGLAALGMACGYSHKTTPTMAGSMPTIVSLNPATATHGDPGFTMTVTGTNFNQNAFVTFTINNTPTNMMTSWTDSAHVKAQITMSAVANAGTAQVTVTNPGQSGGIYGGGTTTVVSAPMNFTIN